ncbi:MAG TPA: YfhO family protein [Thermoanaerobaculia bacterium]
MLPLVVASVALYGATAALLLAAAHRWVWPVRKRIAFVLALLPLLFTGRATLTGGVYGPVDILYHDEPFRSRRLDHGIARIRTPLLSDVVSQMMPWQKAVREAVTEGRVPVWNRFVLAGEPLLAVQQPAAAHPGTWLGLLLPPAQSWTFQMSLRLLLALLSAYLFLRDLGCGEAPALLGAVGWGFSDFLVFYLGYPLANSVGPFPLVLLGLRRLVTASDGRAVLLTAVALTLTVTAGHPETLLFSVAGAGIFFLFELASAPRGRRLRPVLLSLLSGVVALGLSAVQLLPLLEAIPQTWEHAFRSTWYAHAHRSVSPFQSARRAILLAVPYAYGESGRSFLAENFGVPASYAGSLLFPLAAAGLVARGRHRWALLVLGAIGVALWVRLEGVTDLVARLPLFDIGILDYFVFLALFAVCALAALGADRLSRGEGAGAFLAGAAVTAAAIFAIFRFRRAGLEALLMPPEFARARLAWGLAPLLLGALAVLVARRRAAWGRTAPLLVALLLASRVAEAGSVYPTLPSSAFFPDMPLFDAIERDRPERVVGVGQMLVPNESAMYELEDVRGYESMTLNAFYETYRLWCVPQPAWYNRVDDLEKPFLSFLNVRYAVVPRSYPVPAGWSRIAEDAGGGLLENTRVLPRVFVPKAICYESYAPRHFEWLARVADFSEWGIVGAPPPAKEQLVRNGAARVRIVAYLEQAMTVDVDADEECIVGTSITAWKGWKARLDGRAIPSLSYNHAFLGFRVPKGRHRLELRYLSDGFVAGAAISLATLAALLGTAAVAAGSRFRRPARAPRGSAR